MNLEEELENDVRTVISYYKNFDKSMLMFDINQPKEFRIDVQYVHFLVKYFNTHNWNITL